LRTAEIEGDLAGDLADARRSALRKRLEKLVYKVNSVQSGLTREHRDFLTERDDLVTQLARQRLAAELKLHEGRVSHAGCLQQFRDGHSRALAELAALPADAASAGSYRQPTPAATAARATLQSLERSIADLRQPPAESPAPEELALVERMLGEVQKQAEALAQAVKSGGADNHGQLMDMVVTVDEDAARLQEEVAKIQREAALREAQYRSDLELVVAQIAHVRAERASANDERRTQVAKIQAEIDNIEAGFSAQMAKAVRIAARLQAMLENAKWRKGQQLANERERAAERGKLLQENSALKIRLSRVENNIRIASGDVAALTKQVTLAIGSRRAASLLI
jgi:hypothetical protein